PDAAIEAFRLLRYAGHDLIVFHVLDEAEVHFPFQGMCEFRDPESGEIMTVDAAGIRAEYLDELTQLRPRYKQSCLSIGADFVELDTSMPFDKALIEYLSQRRARF